MADSLHLDEEVSGHPPVEGETSTSANMETSSEVNHMEKLNLRMHIGLGKNPGDPPSLLPPEIQPLFFIELAPDSTRRGAKCRLYTCGKNIYPGELRVALNPGMSSWHRMSTDFYHVECFEKIADFSQADFLDRIQPLTRTTWKLRGLKASSVLNGNYLVPGGVERLVLEWKVTRGEWIDKRDGSYDESKNRLDQGFDDLLHKAGSAGYKPQAKPENMERSEYYNLLSCLAPYESDGPDDTEEWNLFDQYLDRTAETLDNPHDLSQMLLRWEIDVMLATKEEDQLGDVGKEEKLKLNEKAIKALKRLSTIPMPQSFFGDFPFT